MLASVFIFSAMCSAILAEPSLHTERIRFPEANSDKIVVPKPVKEEIAPYPPDGYRPYPVFELPEPTYSYLPPVEPEANYGPPEDVYGPPRETNVLYGAPKPELTYGSPADTYAPPSEINELHSATVANTPLTLATQFTPQHCNKYTGLHPVAAAIVNAPVRPLSHITLPRPERVIPFRPKRPPTQSQQLYPKTHLTLPHINRLTEFRPRRVHNQQQTHFFNRPLPSNIFQNSNKGLSSRRLPSRIFSN